MPGRLRALIEKEGQYEGLYDPQRGRFYPAEGPRRRAQKQRADLVCLYSRRCLYQPSAQRIVGVCPVNQSNTSTAAGIWQTQNALDLIGGVSKSGDRYVDHTMFDMVKTLTIADSLKFGKAVLEKMAPHNLHKNRVEQAASRC